MNDYAYAWVHSTHCVIVRSEPHGIDVDPPWRILCEASTESSARQILAAMRAWRQDREPSHG